MKKVFLAISVASVFTACSNGGETTEPAKDTTVVTKDTTPVVVKDTTTVVVKDTAVVVKKDTAAKK